MGESWRVGVDPSERTALVVRGPFRVVRNPIFTTMAFTALGFTLLVPSVLAIVGFVGLLVSLELQVRAVEEPYATPHPRRGLPSATARRSAGSCPGSGCASRRRRRRRRRAATTTRRTTPSRRQPGAQPDGDDDRRDGEDLDPPGHAQPGPVVADERPERREVQHPLLEPGLDREKQPAASTRKPVVGRPGTTTPMPPSPTHEPGGQPEPPGHGSTTERGRPRRCR